MLGVDCHPHTTTTHLPYLLFDMRQYKLQPTRWYHSIMLIHDLSDMGAFSHSSECFVSPALYVTFLHAPGPLQACCHLFEAGYRELIPLTYLIIHHFICSCISILDIFLNEFWKLYANHIFYNLQLTKKQKSNEQT